jgi:FMN phosphatase YigB (HAD superfamily)
MIKFVYFDVGGVVIRDYTGTGNWDILKRELGIMPERFGEFDRFWAKYNREICLTRPVDALIPLIESQYQVEIPRDYSLLKDGFVSRFEKNPLIWPVIDQIRQKAKIGLLTDMYPGMFTEIKKRNLLPKISWDVILDSSKAGFKKPDRELFELAEKKSSFSGKQILFVENTRANIDAASQFNWQTYFYDSTSPEKFSAGLKKLFV